MILPDDLIVPWDDPNEEITEGRTASTSGTSVETISVQSSPPESTSDVSQKRSSHHFCPCLLRHAGSVTTNSEISTPRACDSHSASRDDGVVLPQVVAWFQSCFRVSHVFGLQPPRKVDSTDRTHIPEICRAATNGSGVVGKIATTARMMCLYVLMVGATSCLNQIVHAFPVADALPTSCPCVNIFHVDLRDSAEHRVQRKCLM